MGTGNALRDTPPRDDCLDDYRAAVERLLGETVDEFGRQPMPPEKLSMIAVAVASLPMIAIMLPTTPIQLQVWQVGLVQAAAWFFAFRIQSQRYNRFHAAWQRKVAAHRAVAVAVPVDARLLGRRQGLQRGRSGQTTGDSAAR
jgi:hypothetical protein